MSRNLAPGDRLKTIAATAIVTSVGWLAFGAGVMDGVGNLAVLRKVETVPGASPAPRRRDSAFERPPVPAQSVTAPRAAEPANGAYLIPVAGIRADQLTDTFTAARGGGSRVHDSIDIVAPRGTPVLAAAGGWVEKLFTSKPGGLTIYVRSPDRRIITYYAHLDSYASGLREGQQVRAGQQIGTVGSTGNAASAGPHLHFEIMQTTPDAKWWEPTAAINPYPLLAGQGR